MSSCGDQAGGINKPKYRESEATIPRGISSGYCSSDEVLFLGTLPVIACHPKKLDTCLSICPVGNGMSQT